MVASKLLIEKLQEEVKELKSGGLPTMKDLQEQVDIMIQKSDVKVEKMYWETSKFVNSLEDKVQAQQEKWEKIQKEEVEVQNQRLTTLEKYNIDLEKYKISCEEERIKLKEEVDINAEEQRSLDEQIRALVQQKNVKAQVAMGARVTELENNTSTHAQTGRLVEMLMSQREHIKACENNLKRDNTHVIVSPLKKSRQTEENSGLMQTE